jgi:UDP-N-acetylmuramoylalanine--D-glutamate ligase
VNDSKSTNVASLLVALEALPGPLVLIAGGRDKGTDLAPLVPLVRERVRALVLIGEAADRFAPAFAGATAVHRAGSLDDAARRALTLAARGDTVLLSPACASFDMFRDYEHRGDVFREIARSLAAEEGGAA